jgi:Acyl-CoA synthetases (AMP-forming)/AMP-acid ligases II
VDLIGSEDVTLTAGVPTVWIDVLDELDEHGGDLSSLERIVVGGSAAPEEVTRRYKDEYDVTVEHAWGMTETMSIGAVSRPQSLDGGGVPGGETRQACQTGAIISWTRDEGG